MSILITLCKYNQMKKQQSSTSYQEFHQKLRSKYKKEKQERKQNLRQIPMKKLAESSQGSNDEEYLKKRGNNWWTKMNRRFFQIIPDQQVENIRQFTTSQDIMQFGALVSPLLNYYQQIICRTQPIIFQDDSIRIVYRIENILTGKQKHILAGYFTKLSNPQSQINNEQLLLKLPNFYSFHTIGNKQEQKTQRQYNQKQYKQVDVYLGAKCQDQKFIQKCLQYETNFRKQDVTQIQNQIACWNYQLNQQHQLNNMYWDQIQMAIEEQKQDYPEMPDIKNKIEEIKKYLIACETISYFRSGYSDKTAQQYQKALQYIKQNQQQVKEGRRAFAVNGSFFQTDCKVCFCTKNQPSNKVIYCDYCNTSFHQSCYGVVEIDQQNDFICDACVYLKKMENLNKTLSKCESPSCQICGKNKFPMKNIDSHFYHVSCLILFGFAQIRQFKIHLEQGVNHDTIMEAVVQNQIQHDYCEYCVKNSFIGMQFKCSDAFCAKSYHPICAYLNGCIFKILRKKNGVQVKVQCREHTFPNFSEQATQVYFRRFLCDFKSTSKKKQQDFKQQYLKQLQKLSKSSKMQALNQSGITKIFKVKRFHHHNPDKQRSVQSSSLKKSQSLISNNSNSKSNEPQMKKTQSQKLKQPQKQSHSRF